MSDAGFYEDENGGWYPTEDELIAMVSGSRVGLPGKNISSQLNFLQDLEQTLGVPLVQGFGVSGANAGEQWVDPVSKNRQVYGNNPLYSEAFDLIDAGNDPLTVWATVSTKPEVASATPEVAQAYQDVLKDYAFEVASATQDRADFESKNQGAYLKADGSRYKNMPLGGNDIYGMASEYDLLGAPTVEQGLQNVAARRMAAAQSKPGVAAANVDTAKRDAIKSGLTRSIASTAGRTTKGRVGSPGAATQNARRVTEPAELPEGFKRSFSKIAGDRIERSKKTMVRSEANKNTMNRILGLMGFLQGGQ